MNVPLSGGCQCGAVRYTCESFGRASICHCRMCQKAVGGFFAPLVTGHGLKWTRGEPKYFQSSNLVRRGFCGACGTPLTYESSDIIEVTIATLDNPQEAPPTIQVNHNDRLPFTEMLATLPIRQENENSEDETWNQRVISYQHPDRDTEEWPPAFWFSTDHF